jgi:iron(III) transport system substrate-binding protein
MARRPSWLAGIVSACLVLALGACSPGTSSGAAPAAGGGAAPAARSGAPAASGAAPAAPAAPAAQAPAASPELQALVEAARKEGSLSFVWGDGTMGGSEGIARLAAAFNRYYGLNLDVKFTPGPSMPNMSARIADEYRAGRTAASDIQVGYANHILASYQADALQEVDWASWAPNVQAPELVSARGAAVAFQSSTPGIAYNTQRVRGDAIPRSLQDLLKPEYKGRIASTPYAASFDQVASSVVWGEQRTMEYLRRFVDQVAGLIRCNEMERLTSGEYDILALACSQNGALEAKAKGAPLDLVIPTDAPLLVPLYAAVPKHAAHPAAAKLWINYLMSREAQDLIYEYMHGDNHEVPGSKTAKDLERMAGTGLQFTRIDIEFYQTHDEKLGPLRDELQRILTRG